MGVLTRRKPQAAAHEDARRTSAEVDALGAVVEKLGEVGSSCAGVEAVLESVRSGFGFDYASAWRVREGSDELELAAQTGSLGADLTRMTTTHRMTRGFGLCGVALASDEIVDLVELGDHPANCARGEASLRAGARGAMALPIRRDGRVVMMMDFLSSRPGTTSATRPAVLRALAQVVSQTLAMLESAETLEEAARDQMAVTTVVAEVGSQLDEQSAVQTALDAVRSEFGWAYGSFWALDPAARVLRFSVESGTAGDEFRRVTLGASFAEGVGLSGRAWRARDLVFVPDLGELTDCVRAPAAQRAGVRSGVCLPIIVDGAVIGTMDFFATETIELSGSRRGALRNVARLVSQRLDILRRAARESVAATELLGSVEQLSASAAEAGAVALDAVAQASAIAGEVQALSDASAAIGDVIRVITSIADQTNLLALNATIEAARAGQAGRGFAVVATEVKELAGETTVATGRVGERVEDIQTNTATVARGIQAITATIGRMDEVQTRMSQVLEEQRAMARAFETR